MDTSFHPSYTTTNPSGKPKGIFDPCPDCGADAWCHQTTSEKLKSGAPNPYYGKWWTKCAQCGGKRNYDTAPAPKPRNNKNPTFEWQPKPQMQVTAPMDGIEQEAQKRPRLVQILNGTENVKPISTTLADIASDIAKIKEQVHYLFSKALDNKATFSLPTPLSIESTTTPQEVALAWLSQKQKEQAVTYNNDLAATQPETTIVNQTFSPA